MGFILCDYLNGIGRNGENCIMETLLNILLFPKELYKKLTNDKNLLLASIIIIGLIDTLLPNIAENSARLFKDKTGTTLGINILAFAALVVFIGLMDVLFMSLPLRDLFKIFKKEEDSPGDGSLIKIMKIYIMSHIIIIPVNMILNYTIFKNLSINSSAALIGFAIIYDYTVMIWSTAIISRGINSIYNFQILYKKLVFPAVLLWGFLVGTVLGYVIDILEKVLFR